MSIKTLINAPRPTRLEDFELVDDEGNADLYVLVDPCDDDSVEMVSVGSSRINVIDEGTCP